MSNLKKEMIQMNLFIELTDLENELKFTRGKSGGEW